MEPKKGAVWPFMNQAMMRCSMLCIYRDYPVSDKHVETDREGTL